MFYLICVPNAYMTSDDTVVLKSTDFNSAQREKSDNFSKRARLIKHTKHSSRSVVNKILHSSLSLY